MLPNALIVRVYVTRSLAIWLGTRALASLAIAFARENPFELSFAATTQLVLLSAIVGIVHMWRNHERALLGNLGLSPVSLGALILTPAVIGEAVLWRLTT